MLTNKKTHKHIELNKNKKGNKKKQGATEQNNKSPTINTYINAMANKYK